MLLRSHWLRGDGLIYIPGVSPWKLKVAALFPTFLQLNNGGQQGNFQRLSMIFVILRVKRVPFSFKSAHKLTKNMMKFPLLSNCLIRLINSFGEIFPFFSVVSILLVLTFPLCSLFFDMKVCKSDSS